jgi:meiotically up-regulated gene 157 (Mug157) protein
MMTQEQLITLGNATRAIPDLADEIADSIFDAIAAYWNALSSTPPTNAAYWVWRTSIPASDYTGSTGIVWTEVDSLTTGKARIFEWLTAGLTAAINAADPNKRQGIADAFGAGTTTRTNLLTLARREARRAEQLFATGTGSTASPATMTWEGQVAISEASRALQLTAP